MSANVPTAGLPIRWGGRLAVVLCIIGGLLGMHVVAGGSMSAAHMSMVSGADSSHVMPDGVHLAEAAANHNAAHSPTGALNCHATGHGSGMSMHGGCTPAPSSTVLSAPQPGSLTLPDSGSTFQPTPKHGAAVRDLDPPSLSQLSISRT